MSLVVALSWNDTIKKGIADVYPGERENFKAKLIYSLVITFAVVLLSQWMMPDTAHVTPPVVGEHNTNYLSPLKLRHII